MNTLTITNLHARVQDKKIIDGITLEIKPGEVHAIMGPNGSGKSTLSYIIAGHPKYTIEQGTIRYGDKDLLSLKPHERSHAGIFLAFQYPTEVQGLSLRHFLYSACKARDAQLTPAAFNAQLMHALTQIEKDTTFSSRSLNVGFSGGEKKRAEVLQLLLLKPKLAILDETDSGLDVDAFNVITKAINSLRGPDFSALVITHYPKMLESLHPDVVHIMINGKIVLTGKKELIEKIENEGYSWLTEKQ